MKFKLEHAHTGKTWQLEIINPDKGSLQTIVRQAAGAMKLEQESFYFYHPQMQVILDPRLPLCELGLLENETILLIERAVPSLQA